MEVLDIPQYSIIGNSMGGSVALSIASAHPDRVDRLVCMGSVGIAMELPPGLEQVWGYQPSQENMSALVKLFVFDQEIATDDLIEQRYLASRAPGVPEAWAQMFPTPRQRCLDDLSLDTSVIRQIRHATLLVHGGNDRVIPFGASVALFEALPRADLHIFGRCGHWVMIERTREFNALVSDFLA
jgi:2-hydroxymuconate-semialdehyde hydrolase